MNDRQIIVKALKAIASAFSFCDTDMGWALWDSINTIHEAIEELANDDSAPKNGVSVEEVVAKATQLVQDAYNLDCREKPDAYAASVSVSSLNETANETGNADGRAKLMEDANAIAIDYWHRKRTWGDANDLKRDIIALLDRQDAITKAENGLERRCPGYDPARHYCKYHAQDFGLNDRTVSRLRRENSALARDLAECERMREGLRARLSEAIGKASEIAALGDLYGG